jgi:hypothetical protein
MHSHRAALSALALTFAAAPAWAGTTTIAKPAESEKADLVIIGEKIERSLPRTVSVVNHDLCFDLDATPAPDGAGRLLKLNNCYEKSEQAFTLDQGVLYVGYERDMQIVPDIRSDWKGCMERWLTSKLRSYRLAVCNDDGPVGLFANFYDPNRAVLHSNTPVSGDVLSAGRPLLGASITDAHPPRAIWSYVSDKHAFRLDGTNLCITPPYGDLTINVPLSLDDCDKPMMSLAGEAGPTDGRARVHLEQRAPQGKQYYLP